MSEGKNFEPYTTMTREELLSHVQSNMSDKRYQHCLRVERKILELAKLYDVDEKAASFVGLAHDYAKEIPVEQQLCGHRNVHQSSTPSSHVVSPCAHFV